MPSIMEEYSTNPSYWQHDLISLLTRTLVLNISFKFWIWCENCDHKQSSDATTADAQAAALHRLTELDGVQSRLDGEIPSDHLAPLPVSSLHLSFAPVLLFYHAVLVPWGTKILTVGDGRSNGDDCMVPRGTSLVMGWLARVSHGGRV